MANETDTGRPEWADVEPSDSRSSRREWGGDKSRKKYKTAKYVNSEGRVVNTREYAIAWGVINKPYSKTELVSKCQSDPEAPSWRYLIEKEWNGYTRYYNALVKAGMEPRPPRSDAERRRLLGRATREGFVNGLLDKDYDLARMAAQYGVTTQKSYKRIRRENPDARALLPNETVIVKRFGTWKRFAHEVMKYNIDAVITNYVKASAEAGHWLRLSECDKLKIPLRTAMDILRPDLFNQVCYRKLAAMGLDREEMKQASKENT